MPKSSVTGKQALREPRFWYSEALQLSLSLNKQLEAIAAACASPAKQQWDQPFK